MICNYTIDTIHHYIKRNGKMKLKDLAEQIGVSSSFLSKVLQGKKSLPRTRFEMIAKELNFETHDYMNISLLYNLEYGMNNTFSFFAKVNPNNIDKIMEDINMILKNNYDPHGKTIAFKILSNRILN